MFYYVFVTFAISWTDNLKDKSLISASSLYRDNWVTGTRKILDG